MTLDDNNFGEVKKKKFTYYLGHNILTIYSVSVQVRFAANKVELDIQYNKLYDRVDSRVCLFAYFVYLLISPLK